MNSHHLKYNIMKSVITFAVLGFAFLSCEKKEISPPADTPDPMELNDNTSAAPMSSDTIRAADSISRSRNTESDTTTTAR